MKSDPGFLKLRKIRAAQNIARTVAEAPNNKVFIIIKIVLRFLLKVYLPAGGLMLNIADSDYLDVLDKKRRWFIHAVLLCSLFIA